MTNPPARDKRRIEVDGGATLLFSSRESQKRRRSPTPFGLRRSSPLLLVSLLAPASPTNKNPKRRCSPHSKTSPALQPVSSAPPAPPEQFAAPYPRKGSYTSSSSLSGNKARTMQCHIREVRNGSKAALRDVHPANQG